LVALYKNICTKEEAITTVLISEPEVVAPWPSFFLVYGDLFFQLYDETARSRQLEERL